MPCHLLPAAAPPTAPGHAADRRWRKQDRQILGDPQPYFRRNHRLTVPQNSWKLSRLPIKSEGKESHKVKLSVGLFQTSFSKNGPEAKWHSFPPASVHFPSYPRSKPWINHPGAWPSLPLLSPLLSAPQTPRLVPRLVLGQARGAHLIQSRSLGVCLVSCEVFLRVALLQSGLGAQDLQGSGQATFPGIPGHSAWTFPTHHSQGHRPSGTNSVCTRAPGRGGEG